MALATLIGATMVVFPGVAIQSAGAEKRAERASTPPQAPQGDAGARSPATQSPTIEPQTANEGAPEPQPGDRGSAPEPSPALDARPAALRDVGIDQKLGAQIPLDLVFRDETGRQIRLGEYFRGRPVVLTMNYYECPMLCTVALNGLVSSLRALSLEPGRDFTIVTVSINPRETPALAASKKKTYLADLARPDAGDGWHFLTGDEAPIRALAAAVGFRYTYDAASGQYAHAAGIILATPSGKLSRYFYGVEFAPRELRLGLVEASANTIGTLADQILLFCYHYDPATGRYGFAAMTAMRIAGLATILSLGIFVLAMRRRERRTRIEGAGSTRVDAGKTPAAAGRTAGTA